MFTNSETAPTENRVNGLGLFPLRGLGVEVDQDLYLVFRPFSRRSFQSFEEKGNSTLLHRPLAQK